MRRFVSILLSHLIISLNLESRANPSHCPLKELSWPSKPSICSVARETISHLSSVPISVKQFYHVLNGPGFARPCNPAFKYPPTPTPSSHQLVKFYI